MWSFVCAVLLVALEAMPTTSSSFAHLRHPRDSSPSADRVVLNTTDVVEIQLNPGSMSLKFEACHKPKCRGTMFLWYSATGTNPSAEKHKDGFCLFDLAFVNLIEFRGCTTGEVSSSSKCFLSNSGSISSTNRCGLNITKDQRLKVQLDPLVEGCEIAVTNGAIWTPAEEGSNLKLGLAVGLPIGIIVVIGVVTLLVIFVGRPWWKERKVKKARATANNASEDPAKRSSTAVPSVQMSTCELTSAVPSAFSVPPPSSTPLAPSVPLVSPAAITPSAVPTSSSLPVSTAPQKSSGLPTPSGPHTPATVSSSVKLYSDEEITESHKSQSSRIAKQALQSKNTKSHSAAISAYDIKYKPSY